MKITVPSVIVAAFLAATASTSSADIYQCEKITGCVATINTKDGQQKQVTFRKGDVISTGAGWVASTSDGWVRLRSRRPECVSGGNPIDA